MTQRNRWPLIAAALLAGCAALPVSREVTTAQTTLYTFVVLAAEGAPIARAITSAAACPDIELDGDARAMSVRAPPGTMPLRPTLSAPANSKPSAFPVLTCESSIPPGTTRATIAGRALPLRSEEHTSELQSHSDLVCRLLLEKKKCKI